jgi:DNA polymerase-3 subunit delta
MPRKLKYFDLFNELNAGKIHSIYFFTEEENFLKDKAFELLHKKIVPEKYGAFNYSVFWGEETKAREIFEALQSPPVHTDKKLVILRNFQALLLSEKKKIIDYVEHPIESSILVIETNKVNLKMGLYAKLVRKVFTYYFYHPYNTSDAARFLQSEALKQKKSFSSEAIKLMVDYVGLNYQELNSELEKLLLYVFDKDRIIVEDVKNCIGISKENNIYELQNALASKDLALSLKILKNLLANGVSPVLIIIMLTRFFKTLWKITILRVQKNQVAREIEKNLGGIYNATNLIRQAARITLPDYPKIFHILLDTDYKLKSLSINKRIILEMMIYKICKNV